MSDELIDELDATDGAKKRILEHGLDLDAVLGLEGSGKDGKITVDDLKPLIDGAEAVAGPEQGLLGGEGGEGGLPSESAESGSESGDSGSDEDPEELEEIARDPENPDWAKPPEGFRWAKPSDGPTVWRSPYVLSKNIGEAGVDDELQPLLMCRERAKTFVRPLVPVE